MTSRTRLGTVLVVVAAAACRDNSPAPGCPPAAVIASIHEAILVAERQHNHQLAAQLVARARAQLRDAPASWATMLDHLEGALAKPPQSESTRLELEMIRDELHASSCLSPSAHTDMHSTEHSLD